MHFFNFIRRYAASDNAVLFMKGTVDRPMSRASEAAAQILSSYGLRFGVIDIQIEPVVRAFLPKFSASSECPQLFIQGEFIGGLAVIRELHEQGELKKMLERAKLPESLPKAS